MRCLSCWRAVAPPALASVHGAAVVAVVPAAAAPRVAKAIASAAYGVVVGDQAPSLASAGPAALGALAALEVMTARPDARIVDADELLPERALAGEAAARLALVARAFRPLDDDMTVTLTALLEAGGALEPAARALPVHVNTMRNRLAKIEALTGYDPREPRDRFALQVAQILGRL